MERELLVGQLVVRELVVGQLLERQLLVGQLVVGRVLGRFELELNRC